MIYLFICIIYFFKDRGRSHSVSKILFLALLVSVLGSILIGRLQAVPDNAIFNEIYIASLLYILFNSYNKYTDIEGYDFSNINEQNIEKYEPYIKWVNVVFFAINLAVFISVFALLSSGIITVQEHKNEGGAAEIFSSIVPSYFISLSYLLSPMAYFSLVFHFYYLIKGCTKKSIIHLVLSLGIVLSGLIALSRSALVNYVLVYAIIYYFIVPIVPNKINKKVKIAMVAALLTIGGVFMSISESRFGETYRIESKSLISEDNHPQLVSFLDYYSQWVYFGPALLERYDSSELSWGLYNSSGLAVLIQQRLCGGAQKVNREREVKYNRLLGDLGSSFHGNVVRCVFDFGYIGTFLFFLLNGYYIRKFAPRLGKVRLSTLISMPIFLSFCIGFFSGNNYSSLAINLAMIYMFIFYKMVKI